MDVLIDFTDAYVASLSWSPSGQHIAFATLQSSSQSGTVWISGPDGSQRVEVGSTSFRNWLLDWSPSGDRLVFSSLVDGQSELFSVGADGSDLRRLTSDQAEDLNPIWSRDGRTIVFERAGRDGGSQATWVMNHDGTDQRLVHDEWSSPGWGGPPEAPVDAEPLTGAFTTDITLSDGRHGHTATPVGGSVLVAGGLGGQPSSSVEQAVLWSGEGEPAGELLEPRVNHSATRLADGKILVVGGTGQGGEHDWLASAEVFDPSTGSSSRAGHLLEARAGHTATLLENGRLLIFGGMGYAGDVPVVPLATAELWDPETGTFSPAASVSMPPGPHTATRLADGRVLLISRHLSAGTAKASRPGVTAGRRPRRGGPGRGRSPRRTARRAGPG